MANLKSIFCLGLAVFCVAASGAASAQSFGPATAIVQSNYLAGVSNSAVDAKGNAISVWPGGANRRTPGGSWPNPVPLALSAPIVHVAASGIATAVSTGPSGISVQDSSAKGTWGKARLLVPTSGGALVAFVMNAKGDAMIVYGTRAIRRAAGSSKWSLPETVAVAPTGTSGVLLASAAVGDGGDAVVTYESYVTVCGLRSCYRRTFTLGAARETSASVGFQQAGTITATQLPLAGPHENRATVDAHGVVAVVYQEADPAGTGAVQLRTVTQPRGQTGWGAPATIYAPADQVPRPLAIGVMQIPRRRSCCSILPIRAIMRWTAMSAPTSGPAPWR